MTLPDRRFKLVLDTNALLRGLARRESASGRILQLCEDRKVLLLLSHSVLAEYRAVLGDDAIISRNRNITPESVELLLRRLRYLSIYLPEVRSRFRLDRDRRDEKFIELALSGGGTHLVTGDMDLLSLASDHTEAAKRFRQRLPSIRVMDPGAFVQHFDEMTRE